MTATLTHATLTGRQIRMRKAKWVPIPADFEGQCTGFPDKLLSFRGWVSIGPRCRRHDWHYTILRHHLEIWPRDQWDSYRKWADEQLFLGVVYDLRKGFIWDSLAITIARAVYWTVRSKLGELAAMGRL